MAESKLLEQALDSTTRIKVKVGATTRDIATASGTQAITGVGFQPKYIQFEGSLGGNIQSFHGCFDGTTGRCNYTPDFSASPTAGKWQVDGGGNSITVVFSSSNYYTATVAFNADGFTLTWTKTGTTSGTINIIYSCFG